MKKIATATKTNENEGTFKPANDNDHKAQKRGFIASFFLNLFSVTLFSFALSKKLFEKPISQIKILHNYIKIYRKNPIVFFNFVASVKETFMFKIDMKKRVESSLNKHNVSKRGRKISIAILISAGISLFVALWGQVSFIYVKTSYFLNEEAPLPFSLALDIALFALIILTSYLFAKYTYYFISLSSAHDATLKTPL